MDEILVKFKPRDITIITSLITLLLCFAIYNNIFLSQYKKFINKENEKADLVKIFNSKTENLRLARDGLFKMKAEGKVAIKEYLESQKFFTKAEIKNNLEKICNKLLGGESLKIKVKLEEVSPYYLGFEDTKKGELPIIWKVPVNIVFTSSYKEIFSMLDSLKKEEVIFNIEKIDIEEKDYQLETKLDINVYFFSD